MLEFRQKAAQKRPKSGPNSAQKSGVRSSEQVYVRNGETMTRYERFTRGAIGAAILLSAALGMLQVPVAAQSTGSIVGTITDASGAAVPAAAITAISVQTALQRTQQSGFDGAYSIPLLPVGEYRLEVEQAGFQRSVREGLTLTVSETLTVDVRLEVGQVTESITVTGAAPQRNDLVA